MNTNVYIPETFQERTLSERERDILRTIIHLYILNASPVGSRILSKYLEREIKLSPATIRNVMSELEELDFISHPHTSAGRIPTDKGYRFYVDSLMEIESLSERELRVMRETLASGTSEFVLKNASKLLGMLSSYLSIVAIPHISDLIVIKIELISLSSTRLLVVLALDSNYVRSVTLEVDFEIEQKHLEDISSYINEKISGKPLRFIRDNFEELITNYHYKDTPLIRLFVDSVDKIFEGQKNYDQIHVAGTQNLLDYPEFEDLSRVRGIIELIENEDVIIHLLDKQEIPESGAKILIGAEIENELFKDYSLIVSTYHIGAATGSIGLIGPKRMKYSKMISLVQQVSKMISRKD